MLFSSESTGAMHWCRGTLPIQSPCRRRPGAHRLNPKPFPRRLLGGQFPVVAEDDGGGIAGFEGDLIGALHDGYAVGNERVAQHIPGPRDAEGLGEGGDFAVLAAGWHDPAGAGQ